MRAKGGGSGDDLGWMGVLRGAVGERWPAEGAKLSRVGRPEAVLGWRGVAFTEGEQWDFPQAQPLEPGC